MKVAKKELKNYYDKKGGKMTKKFILKYLAITAIFTCMFVCISGVSADEIITFSSSSGVKTLKCGESSSWRSTVGSTDCVTILTKITRVSCSSTLADATARVIVGDNTTYASTTSTKRTVEAVVNFALGSSSSAHKHNYTAYYG